MCEEEITEEMRSLPLTVMSEATRRKLSRMLNVALLFRSDEGYQRDWRGVACLTLDQDYSFDKSVGLRKDSFGHILKLWYEQKCATATVGVLLQILGRLDRWDVVDDVTEDLIRDCKRYINGDRESQQSIVAGQQQQSKENDIEFLTQEDMNSVQSGLPLQQYDGFLLFVEEDSHFAEEMIAKLENSEHHFKLCIKQRDVLVGITFEHIALMKLIEERCRHLIVILTKAFLLSPANKFLLNYTQALQIEQKSRKIIPLLYEEDVVIPRNLKIYTHLRYTKYSNGLYDFWGRLVASIRDPDAKKLTQAQQSLIPKKLCDSDDILSMAALPQSKVDVSPAYRQIPKLSTAITDDDYKELKMPSPPRDPPSPNLKERKKWTMKRLQKVFKRKNKSLVAEDAD